MKKKIYSKKIVLVILVAIMIMTGCSDSNKKVDEQTTENKVTNATTMSIESNTTSDIEINIEKNTEVATEVNTPAVPDIDITPDTSKYMTTEGFYSLSEAIDSYIFDMEINGEDAYTYEDRTFRGEYKLSSDVKGSVIVYFNRENYEGYIDVDGIRKTFYAANVENVAIIDIDEGDAYKEIAIYDAGPSGAVCIMLFRLYDGTIYELGQLYGMYDYDSILFDKNGKIIDVHGYVDFLDTKIVTEYYQIKGNEARKLLVNADKAMNKEYKVAKDVTIAFTETENTNIAEINIDISETLVLEEGEEIVLIIADPSAYLYYVELPDGRRGYMTTQVAG